MKIVAGRHIRAGRKLIGWDVRELAERAGVEPPLIRSLEDDRLEPNGVANAVATALANAGVRFLRLDECRVAGVWLARPIAIGWLRGERGWHGQLFPHPKVRTIVIGMEQRALIGAACGLLKWSQRRLASRAGVSAKALRIAWQRDGPLEPVLADALFCACRKAGIRFRPAEAGSAISVALTGKAAWDGYNVLTFKRQPVRGWE